MDLIFSDVQLTDMTVAMVGAFPVIAVAFYAARAGPDDLGSVSDDQKRIWVPDKWAKGWRWEFLQWVALTFDESDEQNPELTPANLHHMTVLDQCLKEAERMFPPLPVLMRVAMSDFTHDGYTVPKGGLVFVSPGASHRRPDVFRDPDDYCPARFGPGREEDRRTPYGLIGFGGGQHGCTGLAFAHQQLKIIWSLLLRRFDLEAMQPLGPPDHSTFVVRPRKPCMIRYRRREATP
jgi:cytochrome P450